MATSAAATTTTRQCLCQWTTLSLETFALLPAKSLLRLFIPQLPFWCVIVLVIAIPHLIVKPLAVFAANYNYVTLVDSKSPTPLRMYAGVAMFSLTLGTIFDTGLNFLLRGDQAPVTLIGLYLILLAIFHFSEFFVTSLTNPSNLSTSSFLIDNSTAYIVAISSSFVEFILEIYFFPNFKQVNLVAMAGFCMSVVGEIIRKLAMFTAGTNFSHTISISKDPSHQLVRHGVYKLFRHPSYAGWFYWAIGTQIMLQNPICFVMFTVMSCQFFKERILYEENLLIRFFGNEYRDYKKRVKLWMPLRIQ